MASSNLLSLRDTKGYPRIVVSYEDLFHKTLPTLHRLADQLTLPWPKDEQVLQDKIDGFIDPNLQKSDSGESMEDFKAEKNLEDDVKELYLLGVQAANDDEFLASDKFDKQINELIDRYVEKYGSLYRDFNVKIDSKTTYVYGSNADQIKQVNTLLSKHGVQMDDKNSGRIHKLQKAVSDRVAAQPEAIATYDKSMAYLEAKEDLNNYIRKSAKYKPVWGIGDALTSEIVEMLMTINEEMALDTRNILIVDDQAMVKDSTNKADLLKRYNRVLNRISDHPHLVVLASSLTKPEIAQQIIDFVDADNESEQLAGYQHETTEEVTELAKLAQYKRSV